MESIVYKEKDVVIKEWYKCAPVKDFPENGGAAIKYNNTQIAIFNFTDIGEWFATQNMCPHKYEMALARGLIGDFKGEPKVTCPFHKKSYSLKDGKCITGDDFVLDTYPVKIEDGYVFVGIPEE